MRAIVKAILLAGLIAMPGVSAMSEAMAADLGAGAKPLKRAIVHKTRAVVVRDYDGTPIVLRRSRLVTRDADGSVRVQTRTDAYPVTAEPPRYLNGQPVQPARRVRVSRAAAGY